MMALLAVSFGSDSESRSPDGDTTVVSGTDAPPTTVAPPSNSDGVSLVVTRDVSGDVFALAELVDGLAAGFGSALTDPTSAPDDTRAAAPDGRGGVVFVTENEIWHVTGSNAAPTLLESPGTDEIELVGLRSVDGVAMVLVRIGAKLIGYTDRGSQLIEAFTRFSGRLLALDVDGAHAAGLVEFDNGATAVELLTLVTAAAPVRVPLPDYFIEPEDSIDIAISGGQVAVLRGSAGVTIAAIDGTSVEPIGLGVDPASLSSVDLSGAQLLVAFGEAATSTNIFTGERVVVDSLAGWVLTASWANAPEPERLITEESTRFRVATETVAADSNDPFLNVRTGVGVDHDLLAKLPPTYTGVQWTGEEAVRDDGEIWYEIELLDPVALSASATLRGRTPIGWVNAAFLEALPEGLPVTLDEIPACSAVAEDVIEPAGIASPAHVYALESATVIEGCLRTVLTFGTGVVSYYSFVDVPDGVGPASRLPDVRRAEQGTFGVTFDLAGVSSVWSGATETADGVYVVHGEFGLVLAVRTPTVRAFTHFIPERGIVVVDLVLDPDVKGLPANAGIVLTQSPLFGSGSIDVAGIARPFESSLDVRIENSGGDPIEAVFAGSLTMGTLRATNYTVSTPGSSEAWAPFAVQALDLAPGDYTLVLGGQGGSDDPDTLRFPFAIEHSAVEPTMLADDVEQAAALAFTRFALGGPVDDVPFADIVKITAGLLDGETVSRSQLSDRDSWDVAPAGFRAFDGPINILDDIRIGGVKITAGPIRSCASPPLDWPDELDSLPQVNIQPVGVDSCLWWFAVVLWLDDSGMITNVALDIWEP